MKTITEYTIVPTSRSADLRAAADECNRKLMDAGDNNSLGCAQAQIAECAACLRDGLRIDAQEFEIWQAWLDGKKDEAEMFRVPVGGVHDVAALGADALGVDVSEALNVARV